ncbi:MAG: gluconokinase [Balneolaceae bacterium]
MEGLAGNKIPSLKKCFIIFGVSGCGKSTVGKLLASKQNLVFLDADNFHPQENINKLKNGIALTDSDRIPWLKNLSTILEGNSTAGFVLACSALKESYRELLSSKVKNIQWVFLEGKFEIINKRLLERKNHFMHPNLLRDQLETLEVPDYGFKVSIEYSPETIVTSILNEI